MSLRNLTAASLASWTLGGAYLMVSRGLNDVFPFTALPMYADAAASSASHLMAVDGSGAAHYVDEFTHWHCEPALPAEVPSCGGPDESILTYVERDDALYVRDHAGTGREQRTEDLRIVRRIWVLEDRTGPPAFSDCVITRCRAVPR